MAKNADWHWPRKDWAWPRQDWAWPRTRFEAGYTWSE